MDNITKNSCQNSARYGRVNSVSYDTNCKALKKRFQQIEFAITETVLYLDAYPECSSALEYYHLLVSEREQLLAAINNQCGPMTHNGNMSKDSWLWINGPWPWKYEAN